MNKRTLGIILLIITVIAMNLILLFNSSKIKYNEIIITEEEYNEIINNKTRIEDDILTSIKFNNYDLYKSSNNVDIYYSLLDNNKRRYNPTVRYVANINNSKIAIVDGVITDEIIESNKKIKLVIYNDDSYREYTITCTTLPIMNIDYDKNIEFQVDTDYNMDMFLFDNQEIVPNRYITTEGKIEIKGKNISSKNSFNISLKEKSLGYNTRNNEISLLDMRKDNNYVLYSLEDDQEKIRNVLASRIWYDGSARRNSFDLDNGMYFKYIELFINGEYQGLYALGYPIDEKVLELSVNRNGKYDEYQFKKINDTETLADYSYKNAKSNDDRVNTILTNYNKAINKIKNVDELKSIMDYDNYIDLFLFIQFVNGVDNINKDLYITLKNNNGRIVSIYTPWDLIDTFGNLKDETGVVKPYGYKYDYFMNLSLLPLIRINDKTVMKDIKDRYKELRETTWSTDSITNYINDYEKDIFASGAFLRDKEKWTDGLYSDESVKLNTLKEYINNRLTSMDKYIDNL